MGNYVEQVVGERAKAGECKEAADDAQQRPARSWGLRWVPQGWENEGSAPAVVPVARDGRRRRSKAIVRPNFYL